MSDNDEIPSSPTTTATRRRRGGRAWAAIAGASLAMVVLAGCGGSDSAAGSDGAAASSGGSSGDMEAYQACLAENGVELPDMGSGTPPQGGQAPAAGEMPEGGAPGGGVPGGDSDAFAKAQDACADLAPAGGMGGGMGQGGPNSEEFQAYTDCLTENGVELTQPDAGAEGGQPGAGGPGGIAGLDESDPGVAACADLKPDMSAGPGGQAPGQQGSDTTTTVAAT